MGKPNARHSFDRRQFLGKATTAAVASALPLFVPSRVFGAEAPSNRLRVGQIGCGRIARVHDMPSVLRTGLADIVAVCDLDGHRATDGKTLLTTLNRELKRPAPPVSVYRNYEQLLAHSDLDAVVISTPEHWHAQLALSAVRAGKHVYLQKPFTMTHAEGVLVRGEVARSGKSVQIGSQQRSVPQFRLATELVRSGRIGEVQRVEIGLPVDPTQPDPPVQSVPSHLDYSAWLGPTAEAPYTETRVHPIKGYGRPGWLRHDAYCLGMITGWGSHHFDSLHWALDCEQGGPSEVEGVGEFPKSKLWNVHGAYDLKLLYPGKVAVSVSNQHPNGLKFIGDEGWIWVTREGQTTASDPKTPGKPLPPLEASDPRLLDTAGLKVKLHRSTSHHLNWVEAIAGKAPLLAPASVAHRSGTACIVSWIAMKLGQKLHWDAKRERFVSNDTANAMLTRLERAPYGAIRNSKS